MVRVLVCAKKRSRNYFQIIFHDPYCDMLEHVRVFVAALFLFYLNLKKKVHILAHVSVVRFTAGITVTSGPHSLKLFGIWIGLPKRVKIDAMRGRKLSLVSSRCVPEECTGWLVGNCCILGGFATMRIVTLVPRLLILSGGNLTPR